MVRGGEKTNPKPITMEDIMNKRTKRIYVDTSVVNGVFAQRFAQDTEPFWNAVRTGKIVIIASDLLENELIGAPQHVRDFFNGLPNSQIERTVSTDESDNLAERYIAENVVGKSSLDDCKHIAMARFPTPMRLSVGISSTSLTLTEFGNTTVST
jgi:hypothetical protein